MPQEHGSPVWHLNIGGRSEADMLRFGFWEAGGGRRYRAIVERLSRGDRVYLYRNGAGYVAAGVVTGGAAERVEAWVENSVLAVDAATQAAASLSAQASEDDAEYVRAIDWRWLCPEGAPVKPRVFIPGWIAPIVTGCRIRQAEVKAILSREFGAEQLSAAENSEPA